MLVCGGNVAQGLTLDRRIRQRFVSCKVQRQKNLIQFNPPTRQVVNSSSQKQQAQQQQTYIHEKLTQYKQFAIGVFLYCQLFGSAAFAEVIDGVDFSDLDSGMEEAQNQYSQFDQILSVSLVVLLLFITIGGIYLVVTTRSIASTEQKDRKAYELELKAAREQLKSGTSRQAQLAKAFEGSKRMVPTKGFGYVEVADDDEDEVLDKDDKKADKEKQKKSKDDGVIDLI